jgi:CheY-like chemotaxis protein
VRLIGPLDPRAHSSRGPQPEGRYRLAQEVQRANAFLAGKGLVRLGYAIDQGLEYFLVRGPFANGRTVLHLQKDQAIPIGEFVDAARIDDFHIVPLIPFRRRYLHESITKLSQPTITRLIGQGLQRGRADLVVLDIMLTTGSGFDVLKALAAPGPAHGAFKMVLTNSSTPIADRS